MEKIKLSKKIVDIYNYLVNDYGISDIELIEAIYTGKYDKDEEKFCDLYDWWSEDAKNHTDITMLVLGNYDVIYTPEDEIKNRYETMMELTNKLDLAEDKGYVNGMKYVLEKLNRLDIVESKGE